MNPLSSIFQIASTAVQFPIYPTQELMTLDSFLSATSQIFNEHIQHDLSVK